MLCLEASPHQPVSPPGNRVRSLAGNQRASRATILPDSPPPSRRDNPRRNQAADPLLSQVLSPLASQHPNQLANLLRGPHLSRQGSPVHSQVTVPLRSLVQSHRVNRVDNQLGFPLVSHLAGHPGNHLRSPRSNQAFAPPASPVVDLRASRACVLRTSQAVNLQDGPLPSPLRRRVNSRPHDPPRNRA